MTYSKFNKFSVYTELYDDNGYLLKNEEIEFKIFKCNISKGNIVVVYCTSELESSFMKF